MKASLFITCICDSFYPEVGKSIVRILEKNNVEVDFPAGQVCCGQPAFNTGYWEDAKKVAKSVLDNFINSEYVVVPSGSCVAFIKEFYPLIFENDPYYSKVSKELGEKAFEFSEFMVDILKVTDVGACFPHKVTYHGSCHATRLLGVTGKVIKLLNNIKDVELIKLPYGETCCGFGGTFSVKSPEISEAIVDEKVTHIMETGASIVTGTDMGCLMNIEGRLRKQGSSIRALHIAQLLDEGMSL